MNTKFIYDIPYVKQIIGYILIPFLIFIIVCSIFLLIYSTKHKDHENPIYKYKINLACLLISILLVAVFLAILIGFSMALKKQVETTHVTTILSSFVVYSPAIPVLALMILIIKTIKLMMNKPNKKEVNKIEDQENLEKMLEEENNNKQEDFVITIKPATEEMMKEEKEEEKKEEIDQKEEKEEIEIL